MNKTNEYYKMDKPITFISIIIDYIRELFKWKDPDEWDDEDRKKGGWWGD